MITSPHIVDGEVFALHRGALATVIDLATGAIVRSIDAPEVGSGLAWASPVAAAVRLYASPGDGQLFGFDITTWELPASNQIEPFNASPVAFGDCLYVRGIDHLHASAASVP